MTRRELMRHLEARTLRHAKALNLKQGSGDDKVVKRWYNLMFVRGSGARAEYVNVTNEDNWQACRVLLRKHEDARLMFFVSVNWPVEEEGGDGGKGETAPAAGEGKTGKAQRSGKKKCVVQ